MIIEFAGVAGAGKTTIEELLLQRNSGIKMMTQPPIHNYYPHLLGSCLCFGIRLIIYNRKVCRMTLRSAWLCALLNCWNKHLHKHSRDGKEVVINPGPVYWLTALRKIGASVPKCGSFYRMWENMMCEWAYSVDILIFLEAPIEVIINRLMTRDPWRKPGSEDYWRKYYASMQEDYAEVIDMMRAVSDLKTLRFRSDLNSPDEIVKEIILSLDQLREKKTLSCT
jgi:deoxyadenosine/deoxycytidine kinase